MRVIESKNIKKQEGAILMMSLLVLFLMMTSAVALSRIIIGEVKMVVNTTNSLSAFYAADSGIEKGLYYIKYARKNQGLYAPYANWQSTDPFDNLFNQSYNISSSQSFEYKKASTTAPGFTVYNVGVFDPAHVDIINPSGDLGTTINWDPSAYTQHNYFISWSIEDCFPDHTSDKLEITKNSFGSGGLLNAATEKDIVICNCSYKSAAQIAAGESSDDCDNTLTTDSISDDKYYRFSFRPLNSEIKSLSFDIFAHDAVGYDPLDPSTYDIVGIASNASLIVDGIYKNAGYRLQVDVPALGAVSDIFSYVIFSEEELKKDL